MKPLMVYVVLASAVLHLAMPDHETLDSKEQALESQFKFVASRLCKKSLLLDFEMPVLERQREACLFSSQLGCLGAVQVHMPSPWLFSEVMLPSEP